MKGKYTFYCILY